MLNQTVLVGRIVRDPELKETEKGKKVTNLTLAIPRSYKNENGEYDTDFIDVTLWNGVAENANEYLKKGDLVGVKGRITSFSKELEDGSHKNEVSVVAEKLTFLSSKKETEKEEEI